MSNLFVLLYWFFKYKKGFFYLFLVLLTGAILLFAGKIRLEEDISRITGGNDPKNRFEYVIAHHNFADKLIVYFSLRDTVGVPDPGTMISLAAQLTDSLQHRFDSTFIREIRASLPDSVMTGYLDFFYDHLPLYLDIQDYHRLEEMLNNDSILKITERNYHHLLTPASFALKSNITRDPLGITWLALKKLQSLQAGDNFDLLDGYVFSKDHRNLLMFITPANPSSETSKNGILVAGMDQLLREITSGQENKIKSGYFGSAAISVGNANQLKKDIILTLGIAMLLIIAFIAWYFRSIKIPLLGFLPAIFGGGFALAMMSLTRGTISAIALGIGSVILGLIVDYALYIITTYRKRKNIEAVLSEMSLTVVLCALTSAGAFLCLIFLKSAVLHDLGWFAALSIFGAAVFALVILPQLISEKDITEKKMHLNLADRIAGFSFEKSSFFIALLVILILLGIFFFRKADFQKNMMSMNFMTGQLSGAEKDLDRITKVSLKNIYVVSIGKTLDEALSANEKVESALNSLKRSGAIRSSSGVASLLISDSLQRERIASWKKFWTPERKEKLQKDLSDAGKKYGFKPAAFSAFFTFVDRDFLVMDPEASKKLQKDFLSDFITRTGDMTMITTVANVSAEKKELVYLAIPESPNLVLFDRQQLTDRFIAGVKADFNLLVKLSMLFVTILLLISFGRIEIALLAALPMYVSWLITLGFMGFTGIRFNIFNIIISSFIFGLGVDYSILMTRGLLNSYKYGITDISNYKISIFLSSFTTIIGVAVLFFARHPALNSIAMISVVGVSVVVMITYTVQPLLYDWIMGRRRALANFPVTMRIFFKTIITWGNIVMIALIMAVSGMIIFLFPLTKKKKQYLFHYLFSKLSKAYIAVTFPTNRKLINPHKEDFSKPAIIISNHQSLIETPAFLRFYPKILILTNEWVWNSALFGPIARMASFFNAERGIDAIMDQLKEKVDEGYSILIFPEAHRSKDGHIQRFHRGAFYLAEKLQLDILPVVVFGSGDFLGTGAFWGRPNGLNMKILQRIGQEDLTFGTGYSERAKGIRKLYQQEYASLKTREGTGHYYRKKLILNYVYKGPVLEWYLRVKMKLAGNYQVFNQLIPRQGKILDIGCGYGFISYMLMLTSDDRQITGIDHDEEKIAVASNGYLKNDRISFICADITQYPITKHHAFLLSDVLHYLRPEQQEKLLLDCMGNLEENGVILIRDADAGQVKHHNSSKMTEFLSTKVIGFNKTGNAGKTLNFTSVEKIRLIAENAGFTAEVIEESLHTSNTLLVIRK